MPRIEQCRDGSHTVYSETFNQFYHNPNGAVAESIHVFFETSGLLDVLRSGEPVRVLEIGFGTGLNALLLADFKLALGSTSPVLFQSVETSADFEQRLDRILLVSTRCRYLLERLERIGILLPTEKTHGVVEPFGYIRQRPPFLGF